MGRGSLSDRLSRLRAQKKDGSPTGADAPRPSAGHVPVSRPERSVSAAERGNGDRGDWQEELARAGWTREGQFLWKKTTVTAVSFPSSVQSVLLGDGYAGADSLESGRLLFFDTETTGLSGGAGNTVFLIGFGGIRGGFLVVEQYFLSDFPGEREFLESFLDRFSDPAILVSYNGRAFDSQLLSVRFLMNGLRVSFPRHLDLLYPARRFWKTLLPSCSLGEIERSVLGFEREGDIPGSMVPEAYFSFLKNGATAEMLRVFEHNALDVENLGRLFLHMETLCAEPEREAFVDRCSLGKFLLICDLEAGERILSAAWEDERHLESARFLSLHYRRKKEFGKAAGIWEEMVREKKSVFAGIELAKYWEHRAGDYERALAVVENMLLWPEPLRRKYREALAYRRARLLRRLEKQRN